MCPKYCALCYFPTGMNLTMRGLCNSETNLMEGYFDTNYFFYAFLNEKPDWRGMGKSHIYYEPKEKTWTLASFYDERKYAYYEFDGSNPDYPLGRQPKMVSKVHNNLLQAEQHGTSTTGFAS